MTMLPSSTYTRACALWRWTGSELPGGYSTVIIRSSLPGISDNGFDISEVTFASCAISGLHTRERPHARNNMSRIFFIAGLLLFLMSCGLILCRNCKGQRLVSCASAVNHVAAEPVVEADGAKAG